MEGTRGNGDQGWIKGFYYVCERVTRVARKRDIHSEASAKTAAAVGGRALARFAGGNGGGGNGGPYKRFYYDAGREGD